MLPTAENDNAARGIAESTSAPSLSGTFAQQMAHDLGNSLSGISMLIEGLRQTLSSETPLARQLATLESSAFHATEICRQLQAALRGEEPDTYRQQAVDLSDIVNQSRELLRAKIDPSVRLEFELEDGLPPVLADPTRLHQLLLDLVTNASESIDKRAEGTVTVRTGITEYREQQETGPIAGNMVYGEDRVFLEVVDTGCGIPESDLQRIFEPAFTTKAGGHGLGLASVLRIVRGCEGAVIVDSCLEQGTRVCCIFPPARPKQLDLADPGAAVKDLQEAENADGATILLVEDNSAARRGCKILLEASTESNFNVLDAGDGREAVELLQPRPEKISLAVLDWNLPDCQGATLFRKIRQLAPALPVIVVSGMPKDQLLAQCDGLTPDEFLVKPFDGDELIEKVHSLLHVSEPVEPAAPSLASGSLAETAGEHPADDSSVT